MNKKVISLIIIIIFLIVLFSTFYYLKSLGAFTNPNCGTTEYNFKININSKEDFISFLKQQQGDWRFKLDNFRNITKTMNRNETKNAEIDWNKVSNEIQIGKGWFKTSYIINYKPFMCGGYKLEMSNKGDAKVYGCCGI